MPTRRKSQSGSTITKLLGVVVGVVFMLAGVFYFNSEQFDQIKPLQGIDFSLAKTITMIGVVLILFPVIEFLYIKPMKAAIDERNGELERTFTQAEELRASMDQLKKDYEQRLAVTEASAKEQIQAQIREAQNLRQTLMTEATERADALLAQAQLEIEQEKTKALLEIRTSIVDLTLLATEKVIGESLNDARSKKLIEDFITQVEVAR